MTSFLVPLFLRHPIVSKQLNASLHLFRTQNQLWAVHEQSAFNRVISTVCFYGIVPTTHGDRDPQNDLPLCEMTCPTV